MKDFMADGSSRAHWNLAVQPSFSDEKYNTLVGISTRHKTTNII